MGFLKGRCAIEKSKGKGQKAGMLGWRSTHLNQVIKKGLTEKLTLSKGMKIEREGARQMGWG